MRASTIAVLGAVLALGLAASCGGGGSGDTGARLVGGTGGTGGAGGAGAGGNIQFSTGDGTCATFKGCAAEGVSCGHLADGCGSLVYCGDCPAGQTCGGAGKLGQCGVPGCTPTKTCANAGADCGPLDDGCGALLQCGTCPSGLSCGGAGQPNRCGAPPCTNLCLRRPTCDDPATTTTLHGTVRAPNGTDPLPSALVYIPNAAVEPFSPGVSCLQCAGNGASGAPLVQAVTDIEGKFSLPNVPAGADIPIVVQLGRWRRQSTLVNVVACQDNAVDEDLTRLPRNQLEGDIPLIAISTGALDSLECVLRKIGVEDGEFTAPDGGGRIHLYAGNGASFGGTGQPFEDQLWGDEATLSTYDMVLLACQGFPMVEDPIMQEHFVGYTNAGGRLFATHYNYDWLANIAPFSQTAAWQTSSGQTPESTAAIDTSFPKGQALAAWLGNFGAGTPLSTIPIYDVRHDYTAVVAPSQSWLSVADEGIGSVHFTFNTPVGAAPDSQCGRVIFSDFHVEGAAGGLGHEFVAFPEECPASPQMSPQEKLLEFMIFDLGACITPDASSCVPRSCADQGLSCGEAGDGCGGAIHCGTCASGEICGGGGAGRCGKETCDPATCADQGVDCGPVGDGCGHVLGCGTCSPPQTCGGAGVPSRCGGGGPR